MVHLGRYIDGLPRRDGDRSGTNLLEAFTKSLILIYYVGDNKAVENNSRQVFAYLQHPIMF